MSRTVRAATIAVALIVAACGSDPATSGDGGGGVGFDIPPLGDGATGDGGGTVSDIDAGGSTDDSAGSDAADPGDSDGADGAGGCPGSAGCECSQNGDCEEGLCVPHPNSPHASGQECAARCVDTCLQGYICASTSVGGDAASFCVPALPTLCQPCQSSKECEAIGYANAACVDQGGLGAFCGLACATDNECPSGYGCKDGTTMEGAAVKQCLRLPEAGSADAFGTCDCSLVATKKKLSTKCKVPVLDDQGKPVGSCAGVRTCGDQGLGACEAPKVGKDVCDGIDNDCDGKTDAGACDDNNACTIDACDAAAKACKHVAVTDGLDCDADGTACTSGDKCLVGQCIAGIKLDCNDANPCTEDACDAAKGCTQTALDAIACDDGNACTIGDQCASGTCNPGSPKVCESGDPCIIAKCSIKDGGKCSLTDAIDGLPCEDGTACTESDACKGGSCTAGKLVQCDDGNVCTTDGCDAKTGCTNVNANKPCDADGSLCTVGDACVGGTCTPGNASGCDDNNPCTVDACDPKTGKCAFDGAKVSGVPCNDNDVCTDNDACAGGACSGAKKDCNDGNACTTDLCDAKQGCSSTSSTAPCDDGDACTDKDACAGSVCKGQAKACDDGDPCTADSCDGKAGCKAATVEDKAACGVGKWCLAGKCVASCADDCDKAGVASCDGDAVVTCGQSDADLCLDWSAPKACSSYETCKGGACVQKDAPHSIVINEVLYDAVGADNDAFVELAGPPGADVSGWSLVGIDGNGGKAYNAIDLKGKIPADGYFVVVATTAAAGLLGVADQTSAQADYQNGPDSIELRYGSKVVDAVGYGVFADAKFAGEGLPAPDADNGASIGRDALSNDSNDNAKDFKAFSKPTPGADNVVANESPTVALKCPTAATVGTPAALDTAGTADADGQIVQCKVLVDGKQVSTAQSCANLSVTFSAAGSPKVEVVAVDDKGGEGSASCTIAVSVGNKPPTVALACPSTVEVGKAATFDASKSSDADGKIATFTWDFGDGSAPSAGTSALANHVFAKAGNFEVSVEAKDDKGATAKGSCLVKAASANADPVAKLVCPAALQVGQEGTFDGSGSTDADGTIKSYTFVFADGSAPMQGTTAKVNKSFAKTGSFAVTMTVVDDKGAEGKASCSVTVSGANPPDVILIKPASDLNVTQGEGLSFIVDATAKAGKSITSVSLLIDGTPIGTDTTQPYTFAWTVAKDAKTGAKIQVVATATDSSSSVGSSLARTLTVVNQAPVASFSAVVSGALEATVDGSLSSDAETANADLEVRWDWTNDGTFDTAWSKTKTAKFKYDKAGSYTIAMEVRDGVGQVTKTTRKIDLSLMQTVFGTVTTTTWVGTIIVTGNVVVPTSNTLTIAPGTTVQFAVVDADKDGKGDYSIDIQGKLVVQGSAEAPVVFTHYGTAPQPGKGWKTLQISAAGSTITHAVVEFADVGVTAKAPVSLSHVVLRKNGTGARVVSGGDIVATDVEASANVGEGLIVDGGGKLTWTGGKLSGNGGSGLILESASSAATANLSACTVADNGYVGVQALGAAAGLITQCQITGNAYEGLRIARTGSVDPTFAARLNNLWGNATVGARVTKALSLSASTGGYGAVVSTAYAVPGGKRVDLLRWSYSEADSSYSNYCSGAVRNAATSATVVSSSSTASGVSDVRSANATKIDAQVNKNSSSSSYSASMVVTLVAYDEVGAKREASVVRSANSTDLRWNWWGTFPAALPLVTMSDAGHVTMEGFVGDKFDSKWLRGIYHGGETAPGDVTWSGTVYLSGSLTIPAGKTLTIEPNTTVHVVHHDQNADGKGDFSLTVAGTIAAKGTAANPVLFTSAAGPDKAGQWQRLSVTGTSSKAALAYTTLGGTAYGLLLGSGAHDLQHVTVPVSGDIGVAVVSATNVKLSALTVAKATGVGVSIESSSGVTVDGASVSECGGAGVQALSSVSAISIAHLSATKNKGAGVFANQSTIALSQCDLSSNAIGAHWRAGGGKISACNVKFNNYEGIYVVGHGANNPTVAVVGNNLFGNGVQLAGALHAANWSLATAGYATQTSPTLKVTGAAQIVAYQAGYSESDSSYSNYCSGAVLAESPSGSALQSYSSSTSAVWYDRADAPMQGMGLSVTKNSSSSSYSATVSVPKVYIRKKDAGTEVAVMTTSGKLDFKGNYWGDGGFPDATVKVAASRTDAVDLQGPQVVPISGTGPQK